MPKYISLLQLSHITGKMTLTGTDDLALQWELLQVLDQAERLPAGGQDL